MKKILILFSSILVLGIWAGSVDTNNNSAQIKQNVTEQVINQDYNSLEQVSIETKTEAPQVNGQKTNINVKTTQNFVQQPESQKETATPRALEQIDYYENTAGNIVQSPTLYDSRPEGASARCGDGTYSFSQSRRGTCSHHDGVVEWY